MRAAISLSAAGGLSWHEARGCTSGTSAHQVQAHVCPVCQLHLDPHVLLLCSFAPPREGQDRLRAAHTLAGRHAPHKPINQALCSFRSALGPNTNEPAARSTPQMGDLPPSLTLLAFHNRPKGAMTKQHRRVDGARKLQSFAVNVCLQRYHQRTPAYRNMTTYTAPAATRRPMHSVQCALLRRKPT